MMVEFQLAVKVNGHKLFVMATLGHRFSLADDDEINQKSPWQFLKSRSAGKEATAAIITPKCQNVKFSAF